MQTTEDLFLGATHAGAASDLFVGRRQATLTANAGPVGGAFEVGPSEVAAL
jgi:hypothetical protein